MPGSTNFGVVLSATHAAFGIAADGNDIAARCGAGHLSVTCPACSHRPQCAYAHDYSAGVRHHPNHLRHGVFGVRVRVHHRRAFSGRTASVNDVDALSVAEGVTLALVVRHTFPDGTRTRC